MFLHPLSLRVSPPRTLGIAAFLRYLSADLRDLDAQVPRRTRAGSLQRLGHRSEDSEPPHESAPSGAARGAHTHGLAPSGFPGSHGLGWPLTAHSGSPFLPWLPTPARHRRHSRVRTLGTRAGRDEGSRDAPGREKSG